MDLLEVLEKRYSCRKFSDEKLTDEGVNAILEAGRCAPSACNNQPWRFLVFQGEDELAKVDKVSKCRYGAPLAILVCFNRDESAKNPDVTPDYGWIDCAFPLLQMALEAEALGLGSCIVGAYEPAIATAEFNIPDNMTTYQFIMIGHTDAGASKLHETRKSLDEIVVYGGF